MKLQEKPSKIYELSSEYMLHNTHLVFLKFMLNKRFRNKQSIKQFNDSCAETEVYNSISVKFVLAVACKKVFYKTF